MNTLNATELHTYKWLKDKYYVTCILPQFGGGKKKSGCDQRLNGTEFEFQILVI